MATQLRLSQILNTEVKIKDDTVTTSSLGVTTWINKLTLPFTSAGQDWLIFLNAEMNVSDITEFAGLRVRIDGVSVSNVSAVARDLSNVYYPYSGMNFGSLSSGSHTITMDFRSSTGLPVSIRRARIFLFDLS